MTPEQVIAALKLRKLTGQDPFKITKKDIINATNLPKELNKLAEDVVAGKEVTVETVTVADLDEALESLKDLDTAALFQAAVVTAERQNLGAELGVRIGEISQQLQALIPASESFSMRMRFLWRLRVVDNPAVIYDLMSKAQLSRTDVSTLQAVYPELYEMITTSMIMAIINKFTIEEPIPRKLKLMMSVLLQTPVVDVKTLQAYKAPEQFDQAEIKLGEASNGL